MHTNTLLPTASTSTNISIKWIALLNRKKPLFDEKKKKIDMDKKKYNLRLYLRRGGGVNRSKIWKSTIRRQINFEGARTYKWIMAGTCMP